MIFDKSEDVNISRGIGVGGTTTLATGNAVRKDEDLKALGIDLDDEFRRLEEMIPITTDHKKNRNASMNKMFETFEALFKQT